MTYDSTRPADTETISIAPAGIRENFRALKEDAIVNAGTLNGYSQGNSSGNVALSNGTLCTNLNAQYLNGQLSSYYTNLIAAKLPLAGGSMTGAVNLANAIQLTGKNTSGTAYTLAYRDSSNNSVFGTSSYPTVIYGSAAPTYSNGSSSYTMYHTGNLSISDDIVTCATAAATAAKTVTLSGFSLSTGAVINVVFTNANTATAPTLDVNSTGAKSIASENGTVCSSTNPAYFAAGAMIEFIYNGTYWIYKNRIVESYANGTNGYQVWTNGFKKQWGYSCTGTATRTITYPVEFKSTPVVVTTPYSYYENYVTSVTTTSFVVMTGYSYPANWIAEGV